MSKIKHVFFDLDRTLWDFDANSNETLNELFIEFKLEEKLNCKAETFINSYQRINEECWALYRDGKITQADLRGSRYNLTFAEFGYDNRELADEVGTKYIEVCPQKTKLFDGTHDVLELLSKKYKLHIITNGFEEVQHIKMRCSDLAKYFNVIMTSQKAGVKKPDEKIFLQALSDADAKASESVMIGDDLPVDVYGAQKVGMQAILFDPHRKEWPNGVVVANELFELIGLVK